MNISKSRVASIDLLRGIIMILMALDHVRDYFHVSAITEDPTNPATTTPILFFTRWITHFCAPVFVFLSGLSAFLYGQTRTKKELSRFLLTRGLVIVAIEILVFNFLFTFDPLYHFISLQVLWVIGISMILLSVLIYLPIPVLLGIGLALVAGHNLLDRFNDTSMNGPSPWYGVLHQVFFVNYAENRFIGVFYPLIPWPGVMVLGYCAGVLYTQRYDAAARRKLLLRTGWLTVAAFFLFRWLNVYGDLTPWTTQRNTTATILAFFNVTKYPPSFLYLCMTLGPALLLLAWFEKVRGKVVANVLLVYGRVPMFYYLAHFLLIHLLCVIAFFATGRDIGEAAGGMMAFRPNDFGFSLPIVYLIWVAVLIMIYPVCRQYGEYKRRHPEKKWLQYL